MGANWITLTYDGKLTRAEVQQKFATDQDQDRYENGHSYSGGIGMARGLDFAALEFPTEALADSWLQDHCTKWEEAKAVRFLDPDGRRQWLIGAYCAS